MQEFPDPLAQLLRQLMELGAAGVMRSPQKDATASHHPQRNPPAITLSVVTAVTLPASLIVRPVPSRPDAANENAEG